ncbi:MAG: FtsK/SpoIIIE domain-containing protein [Actinomycetota bacterium]
MTARLVAWLVGLISVVRCRVVPAAGLEIGRRFDARSLVVPWPHCPHILIGGETGSGKSGVCNALLGAWAGLPNVVLLGVDLKLVELSPWRDRLTVLATTPAEADWLFVQLRELIRFRSKWLEDNGYRKWRDEFGPWIVLVVDELAELQALDVDVLVQAVNDPDTSNAILRSGRNGPTSPHGLARLPGQGRPVLWSDDRRCHPVPVGRSARSADPHTADHPSDAAGRFRGTGQRRPRAGPRQQGVTELHRTSRTRWTLDRRHP